MMNFFSHESRAQTVIRITQQCMRQTGLKMPTLATNIVEEYHLRVPQNLREIKFHQGSNDAYNDMRANGQMIRRFMDHESRMPVELEEAWVYALPQPYQLQLIRELSLRYGLLAIDVPKHDHVQLDDVATLFKEAGEAGILLNKMMTTKGGFGPEDMPVYKEAMQELNDVVAVVVSIQTRMTAAVAGHEMSPNVHNKPTTH